MEGWTSRDTQAAMMATQAPDSPFLREILLLNFAVLFLKKNRVGNAAAQMGAVPPPSSTPRTTLEPERG